MVEVGKGFGAALVVAMVWSTFHLFAIAVLSATIIDDLGISRTTIGAVGGINTLVGAVLAPYLGRLTDRLGARWSMVTLQILAGFGLLLTAIPSVVALIASAVVSGIPQGWSNPATNRAISRHVAPGRQGVITGIKQSGVQFGIFLSGASLPALNSLLGWRFAVAGFAALAFLSALFSAWVLPRRPAEPSRADPNHRFELEPAEHPGATGDRPRVPAMVYQVMTYGLLLGIAAGGTGRFLPLFAQEVVGLTEDRAGLIAAIGGLAGIVFRVLWGRASETRLAPVRSLWFIGVGSIATMVLVIAAASLGEWSLWVVAVASAASMGAWNAVGMLAVIKGVSTDLSGRASGIVLAGFLVGLTIASPAVGWSVDVFDSYQPAWITIGVMTVLGALVVAPPVTAAVARRDAAATRPPPQPQPSG